VTEFNQGKAGGCAEFKTEYHDWFLPDLDQLASLLDAQAKEPSEALRLAGLTSTQKATYWSATAAHSQLNAWGVNFTNGAIDFHSKLEQHLLLLARHQSQATTPPNKEAPAVKPAPESKTALKSDQRFRDGGDGTVTDNTTGLMWLRDGRCLPKTHWLAALIAMSQTADGQGQGGCAAALQKYPDWTLPNVVELRSLLDYRTDYPALSAGHPFTALAPSYWSATSVAATPEQAFMVDINTGAVRPALKTDQLSVLPVRQTAPPSNRPRKEFAKTSNVEASGAYLFPLDPEMPSEINWPPPGRFVNNGDGTSLDAITGITWLTDAKCLGKKSWKEAGKTLQKFNASKKGFTCANYEGGFNDWQLPTLAEMQELFNKDEKNQAAWLTSQGIKDVQANTLYWTATPTPLNLYFADALNLKTGKAGNYPQSLAFMLWPKRHPQQAKDDSPLLLHMTANAMDNLVTLSANEPISLAVYLHPFATRLPADFWFWYDTPDERKLWLTHIRTWSEKPTPVYQGPLFNLNNYEIYRSLIGLAPGIYDFHFAVDTQANGLFDDPHYETKLTVLVRE